MSDQFKNHAIGMDGPAIGALAIVPSNADDLAQAIRAITIGGEGGTVSFVSSRDGQTYTKGFLSVGTYPLCARRIRLTGTRPRSSRAGSDAGRQARPLVQH